MPAAIDQLPEQLTLTGLAGSPFALTVTATPTDADGDPIPWASFTGIEVNVYTASAPRTAVAGYAPTVSTPSDGVISIVWSAAQTAAMVGGFWPWQLTTFIDGVGPLGLLADRFNVVKPGTAGASTDVAVDLTVEVGTVSVALSVTVGGAGGGSGDVDGGAFSSSYGGTEPLDGGEF